MAKHGKRRGRFRRYLRGSLDEQLDLGVLAANTLVSGLMQGTVEERTFVSSIVATHSLSEYTVAVDDGPIRVGVAHSDYTSAEIESWIENTGSWKEGDKIAQEIGNRKIKEIGTFRAIDISAGNFTLNDGKPIKTKLGWILTTGQTLRLWAFNDGSSALATTAPDYNVNGHANLWPQ